ncbi:hypothetical protein [Promicromonospora sp. NPDC090134]|uniref:hypothetical protein n=1 Tax=Promicromonospora sp. NPDC090134 TaxID=3364408 RepID=UPI00381FA4FB
MGRKNTVHRTIGVGVAAAALAASAVVSVPATAGSLGQGADQVGPTRAETASGRAALESAVDHTAHAATALAGDPGYAGVAVDYDAARVTVSWKGDVPASVGALAEQVPAGVTVDVARAALSEADLHGASTRLLDGQRAAHGPDAVVAAMPAGDYAGLVVEVSRDSAAARTADLAENLAAAAGVPVQVELVDDGVQPTAVSRRNDAAPWSAGGAMATSSGSDYCTTGFSIVTAAGNHKIVSAAHCNAGIGSLVRDGEGQQLGKVTNRALEIDAELIDPVGEPETSGSVFGGPWNASSVNSRYEFPVVGVQQPAVGQNICSSGAVTGEHCGAKVRAVDVAWSCGKKTCHGFRASRDDGGVVVGGGDSGGPMYAVIDGKAYARGMIDGGSNRRSCGSTSVTTQCFSYVYGIPMVDILATWDARIDS